MCFKECGVFHQEWHFLPREARRLQSTILITKRQYDCSMLCCNVKTTWNIRDDMREELLTYTYQDKIKIGKERKRAFCLNASLCSYIILVLWDHGFICHLFLNIEFSSCAWDGRLWYGIILYHWRTASIKQGLLFFHAGYASWELFVCPRIMFIESGWHLWYFHVCRRNMLVCMNDRTID